MKIKSFKAHNLSEALDFLDEYKDRAKLIAGGTDIVIALREGKMNIEGMVDIYNDSKGFGFIKVPASNDKIFFHFKESKELLKVGDQVQFKKEMSEKGFRAIQISKK